NQHEEAIMPASVIVAFVALAIMIALSALNFAAALLSGSPMMALGPAVSVALGILLLLGMIFWQRLAWQWGRILGILFAVLYSFLFVTTLIGGPAPGSDQLRRVIDFALLGIIILCL